MANQSNTALVQNSSVIPVEHSIPKSEDLAWCAFWYDLNTYVHPSWLQDQESQVLSKYLIATQKSKYTWRTCYQLLCEQFEIESNYTSLLYMKNESAAVFIMKFLPNLVKNPNVYIAMAGVSFSAAVGLALGENFSKPSTQNIQNSESPVISVDNNIQSQLSRSQQSIALKIAQTLAMKKRCSAMNFENGYIAGLWLLYRLLDAECKNGWARVRLAFNAADVYKVEGMSLRFEESDATVRNYKRLWQMIHAELL